MFISSSAISLGEVHVLILPFSVGVLPKFFYSFLFYLVLTGVVSESILFRELLILVIFVVPLFYPSALELVHLLSCGFVSPLPLSFPSRS